MEEQISKHWAEHMACLLDFFFKSVLIFQIVAEYITVTQ
jgi:hypothetical protein